MRRQKNFFLIHDAISWACLSLSGFSDANFRWKNRVFSLVVCAAAASKSYSSLIARTTPAQLGQIAKTRQKLYWKNSWNWVLIIVSATIWQVLNVKCIKTGNENNVNQLKIALKNSWNQVILFLAYFTHLKPQCFSAAAFKPKQGVKKQEELRSSLIMIKV